MKEGDLIAGRYRLERRAGTGGMGTVFRAFDEDDRRRVAIKTLSDQPMGDSLQTSGSRLAARFEREASALAAISAAGVVRYVAHGISESQEPYLVMQWVEGQDLASRLNDRGLTSNETLRLGIRLAEALAALHAHGIVHRDVKPANVMLKHGEVERAVLVDLGVARRAGLASATLTGARVGTPSYMAPEQIRDARAVDGRADVFSLGCIVFECLSGRRAFDAEDGLGAIAKILLERAPSLNRLRPDLPGSISDFVAKLLERDPEERPHADVALAVAFSDLLAASSAADSPPPRLALAPKVVTRTEVFGTRAEVADPSGRLRADAGHSAPLPYRKGPLVGREREMSELVGFLSGGARCVWLWGAPGIGKTRLALDLCEDASLRAASNSSVFVELGAARRPDDVLRVLAQRLGARLRAAEEAPEALARALAARGALVVVLDAVDAVSDPLLPLLERFLALAPDARFIVTSRERPRLRSAFALEIGPLLVRAERELLTTAFPESSPAAQLFVQRLREQGHPPPRSPEERLDVERIARALDGVPLALELLAARVPMLGLGRIAADMTLPPAQREPTLGDAQAPIASQVRMSFETLTPAEQRTLFGAAIFAGRFGDDALQAVLAPDLPAAAVLDALRHLREKSLVSGIGEDFALLAPVRDFALMELARAGLNAELARRHGEYQAGRVRELCRLREVEGARKTLLRLEHDADDVLAAIEYALAAPRLENDFVLVALVALEPLITARGPLPAFMSVLDRAIAAADASAAQSSELLARVLSLRGRLSTTSGAFARARADLLRARDIAEAHGAAELCGSIWLEIGVNHHFQRELAAARDCYERALELCRGPQQDSVRGRCYGNLGAVLHDQGRLTEAAAHYWKGIRTLEESGEARELGNFLSNLAVLEQELGARADARRHYQEALSYLRDLAEARLHAIALGNLGVLESEEGAWDAARQCHQRALELLRTQQDPFSEALCRARLGAALAMLQREDEADEELSRARRSIAAADPARLAAVRLQRVFLDLARARRALDAGDRSESEQRLLLAEQACAEIANEQHDGVKLKTLSDDVRAALRVLAPLLRTTRERIAARTDPPATTLVGD